VRTAAYPRGAYITHYKEMGHMRGSLWRTIPANWPRLTEAGRGWPRLEAEAGGRPVLDLALAGRGVLEGELASASGRLFRKQARLNEPGYPNPNPNPNHRRDSMNHCLQKQPSSPHLPLPDYVGSAAVLDEIRAGARLTHHPY
tara:strand:- start:93 stop:521 length:429 start_codon:yes stop_codon:yes gene_type:complete